MSLDEIGKVVLELVSSVVIAIPVSFLSVKFALRKFKSEKWWDKKLQCYSDISDYLSRIIIYADMVLDVELDDVNHDEASFEAQKLQFNEAMFKLQAHAHSSVIFLDNDSYKAVLNFANKLFRIDTSSVDSEKLGMLREEAEACSSVIASNAKKALGV
ncbi:hypothetical protein [Aeromonas media]|uniref:hypothetical protein n=1 Tax=Aeromonas media TaxID=651 RepID=UPI0038D23B59